jgi:hypothetical protein
MPYDAQLQTLLLYAALIERRGDWGGRLVLGCGRDCALSGVPAAASIAGAATLAIDSDEAAVKTAMRRGEVDFVVNTLDEALRTLKNEIRQRRPLSVGLMTNVSSALDEMAERGVQPHMLLAPGSQSLQDVLGEPGMQTLLARGMAYRMVETGAPDGQPFAPMLTLDGERHFAYFYAASDGSALRTLDAALLKVIAEDDLARRRWIQRVSQYLRAARSGGRWVWLREAEAEALAHAGVQPVRTLR